MELDELKSMWQAHELKIEKSLSLNLHCLELIQRQKVKSRLAPLLWLRVVEVALYIIVICWLMGFTLNHFQQPAYTLSALTLIVFYVLGFINCIKQIIIIRQIDYSLDIISLQIALEKLQTYVVNYLRLTFLVIPTYLAYPIILFKALGFDILANLSVDWWKGQIIFCIAILPVCLWLYKEVSYKNIHKGWVRKIISIAGDRVLRSMEFIKELNALKKDIRLS